MTDASNPLDLEELVTRIRRQREESEKFVAEQKKLNAEADKLARDRALAPWQIVISALIAGAALFAAAVAFVKLIQP